MENKVNLCVIDFEETDIAILQNKDFEVYNGTAGSMIQISYSRQNSSVNCLLNYDFPKNLHEFDVVIINMLHHNIIPYNLTEHQRAKVFSSEDYKSHVSYPTNLFDPKPFSFYILNDFLVEFFKKEGIVIVFADKNYEIDYQQVRITSGGHELFEEKIKLPNYSFWDDIPVHASKHGKKIKIVAKNSNLKGLLEDFKDVEYHLTFSKKTITEYPQILPDPNYFPLMENLSEEVISYAYKYPNTTLFVFPDIKNKGEFTSRFLTEIAPEILPNVFASNSTFNWLKNKDYWVPNHSNILKKIDEEDIRHKNAVLNLKLEKEENLKKYEFLHSLITESGDNLVDAVFCFLSWLEFDNIQKVDEQKKDGGVFEEDIRIEYNGKLLVIEIKGIGGTSKDSECSQVSKIRLRRIKERKSVEVYGLYIVNHQRFMPPVNRNNPPFTKEQIQDALNDDRGLLTTWELHKLYYDTENGIFSKEEIKDMLFQYGLIDFKAGFQRVAKVDKTYLNNTVASIELTDILLSVNDEIISEKNNKLFKHKIISIQINNEPIDTATNGRVGLKLNTSVEVNSILYIKKK